MTEVDTAIEDFYCNFKLCGITQTSLVCFKLGDEEVQIRVSREDSQVCKENGIATKLLRCIVIAEYFASTPDGEFVSGVLSGSLKRIVKKHAFLKPYYTSMLKGSYRRIRGLL